MRSVETLRGPAATRELREKAAAELAGRLPAHLQRLSWDRSQVAAHQRDQLRALLAHAAANSPFHARRLAGIDPATFSVADLPALPVMTRADVVASFDEVVTGSRLTLQRVRAHLGAACARERLLLGEYACLPAGGSSGAHGSYVRAIGEHMDYLASLIAPALASRITGSRPPGELVIAIVASPSAGPLGLAAAAVDGQVRIARVRSTLPLADMTRRLNDLQPSVLAGDAETLTALAAQQRAGRLRLERCAVTIAGGEAAEADRAAITGAFGVPPAGWLCTAEGLAGQAQPGERAFTFTSGMCIVELVNADGKPVLPGETADKVLVTNLHNFTQPLIRLELATRLTRYADDDAGQPRASWPKPWVASPSWLRPVSLPQPALAS